MEQEEIKLAKLAGLTHYGDDEYGTPEFMGVEADWNKFEKMKDIYYAENAY